MSTLTNISKTSLIAASLALLFGTANAEVATKPVQLAQAQSTQGSSDVQGGSSGSADQGSGQSASGMSGSSADQQGQSGQTSGGTGMSSDQAGQSGTSGQSGTAGTSGAGKGQGGQAAAGKGKGTPTVFMLVPVEVAAADNSMKQGCWVRIYDRENFLGETLTLIGPTTLADMSGPFGLDWDDRVNSIETGPKAMVTVYDDPGYEEQVAQFKPGQKVADLSKRMGFFDEFASIRVNCQK